MIRRAALAASLAVLFTVNVAAAADASVTIKDFQFVNGTPTIALGNSVSWSYPTGGSHHTSSSNLTSATWGSMAWNFAFSGPGGAAQSQAFHQAGAWSYHCMVHPTMTGQVSVQFTSNSLTGHKGTTFTLTLGDQALPSGFVHDVQKKRNSGAFKTWKSPTASAQTFKPTKKGTYQFRTRVRNTSNGQASGYSPVITIVIS